MKKQFRFISNEKGKMEIFIISLVLALGVILVGGIKSFRKPAPIKPGTIAVKLTDSPHNPHGSVQLDAPQIITSVPTSFPSPTCPPGTHVGPGNDEFCVPGSPVTPNLPVSNSVPTPTIINQVPPQNLPPPPDVADHPWDATAGNIPQFGKNGGIAFQLDGPIDPDFLPSKPIIYLYPKEKTHVNVTLDIPGIVTASDPLYPKKSGWRDIEADPNGLLMYRGKVYHELYYESKVHSIPPPTNGIVLAQSQLKENFFHILHSYGFSPFETQEFVDYWVPRLRSLNAPFILFSVFDKEDKDRIDHVEITPTPDTVISLLGYFKPLKIPIVISPLTVPAEVPKRNGFTFVEWGGIVDQEYRVQ